MEKSGETPITLEPLEGDTPIPDFLARSNEREAAPEDLLGVLKQAIKIKLIWLYELNIRGIKLVDSSIEGSFEHLIDAGLRQEAVDKMRFYRKGRKLSKEGMELKNQLDKKERENNPVLNLAQLILNKIAAADVLSDAELNELDNSIEQAYKEAQAFDVPTIDNIMGKYFQHGRRLTRSASDWLKGSYEIDGLHRLITEEVGKIRQSSATEVV